MTPEQRTARAKIAANSRWMRPLARQDQAEAARAALDRRFAQQVDPTGSLPPAVVAPLLESAKKAHSARMHLARSRSTTTKASTEVEAQRRAGFPEPITARKPNRVTG